MLLMFESASELWTFYTCALPTPCVDSATREDTLLDSNVPRLENMKELLRSASIRAQHYHSSKNDNLLPAFREPLWTNYEVDKFWLVLEPHMKKLIGGKSHLPHPEVDFSDMEPDKISHFESCLLDIQDLIWQGKYSLAVSNFRSVRGYFGHHSSERYQIREVDGELSVLRRLFTRRIPRRKMLCQFKWNSI